MFPKRFRDGGRDPSGQHAAGEKELLCLEGGEMNRPGGNSLFCPDFRSVAGDREGAAVNPQLQPAGRQRADFRLQGKKRRQHFFKREDSEHPAGRLDGLFCFRKSADRSAGFLLMERQMDMQFRESLLSQIASEYRGGLPVILQKQFRDLVIGSQYQIARELISLPDSHRLPLE